MLLTNVGCILIAQGSAIHVDVRYHFVQVSKAFHASRWILRNRQVSISIQLRMLQTVVGSVASYGSPHRTIQKQHLQTISVECRKLVRRIVVPMGHYPS